MKVTLQYDHCKNPHRANVDQYGYIARFNIQLPRVIFEMLKDGKTVQANRCSVKLYDKKHEQALRQGELELEKEVATNAHKKATDEVNALREELNRMTFLMASLVVKG